MKDHYRTGYNRALAMWEPDNSKASLKNILRTMWDQEYVIWTDIERGGWFSLEAIAQASGHGYSTVAKHVKELEKSQWLLVTGCKAFISAKGQPFKREIYRLTVPPALAQTVADADDSQAVLLAKQGLLGAENPFSPRMDSSSERTDLFSEQEDAERQGATKTDTHTESKTDTHTDSRTSIETEPDTEMEAELDSAIRTEIETEWVLGRREPNSKEVGVNLPDEGSAFDLEVEISENPRLAVEGVSPRTESPGLPVPSPRFASIEDIQDYRGMVVEQFDDGAVFNWVPLASNTLVTEFGVREFPSIDGSQCIQEHRLSEQLGLCGLCGAQPVRAGERPSTTKGLYYGENLEYNKKVLWQVYRTLFAEVTGRRLAKSPREAYEHDEFNPCEYAATGAFSESEFSIEETEGIMYKFLVDGQTTFDALDRLLRPAFYQRHDAERRKATAAVKLSDGAFDW